ncbi:MAG: hypothetical protein ACI4DU_07915, partial [Lachnospiraceae bacterium]
MKSENHENEALHMLSEFYYKILRVNLTKNCHEEIKMISSERDPGKGYSVITSEWLHKFADSGNIHPDDLEKYYHFTDLQKICREFREGNRYLCCHYRRKIGEEFRWVSMELVPTPEY